MKNEKLVEATMLALRGKLLEEVDRDFKKVLDYINGDYHRVEDFTDLEVCYPNEEDTDWLDAYDVANELLNKLSKEDWVTMAKEIDDGTLRDKLTDWGMKAGSLEEARSHKDDNERVAPRNIDKLDVSLGSVGNFAPKNSTGDKYTGTTEADYRSKRNRTGRKNDDGVDEYITYNNHYDTAVPTYQDFKWNADEFEKEANKYKNDKRGQYATKMMISHQKEADKVVDRAKRNLKGQKIFDVEESKKVESEEDAINVMNNFRDKNALYGYVVSYLENNAPNNEEILKLCKEILAKGAINVCGKDKINDFYNKCKSDIEARINALGENYIKTILAQYVFEDVIYGLEDNLESAIQK